MNLSPSASLVRRPVAETHPPAATADWAPLEVVALFADQAPEDLSLFAHAAPRIETRLLTQVPPFAGPQSELALLLTPEERGAAAAARSGLLLRCEVGAPSAAWRSAIIAQILKCHELGAVAIVLPAARKVVGPSALSALAPLLSEEAGRQHLFLQFHVVQDDQYLWSHTHGMAHYGLPDLECYTTLAERGFARRLLEGGTAHLLQHGAEAFEPGRLMEITQADGQFVTRLRLCPARPMEGHGYDAWGAFEIVPLAAEEFPRETLEECIMDARSQLTQFIANQQRAHDLDLRGAGLAGLELSALSADKLDLSQSDLRGAILRKAHLTSCRLQGAHLEGADWSGATLRLCDLNGAQGMGARFDSSRLEDSSAEGADFSRASLRGAQLSETSFVRAVLREALLNSAQGDGVDFRGADLGGAMLTGTRLDEGDFRGADLRDADMTGGRFRSADFRGAILDGARLEGADFQGALFDEGAGPAAGTARGGAARRAGPIDPVPLTSLHEGLSALQKMLVTQGSADTELIAHLQRMMDTLASATDQPPDEWKAWLEPLMKMTDDGQPFDLKAVLEGICAAPIGLHGKEGPAGELLGRIRQALDTIESGSENLDEQWTPLRDLLTKTADKTQQFDLKAFLEALSLATQRRPPNPDEPKPS
ncbi:MAG TPA: pentapeptide repeat-containing protein [Chthoniobacterales bacterium]|nr:pentapeptide repeat-containing protein [Chthoniobacterales bacterium]